MPRQIRTIPVLGAAIVLEAFRKKGYALNENGDEAEHRGGNTVRLSIKEKDGHRRFMVTIPDEMPGFGIEELD